MRKTFNASGAFVVGATIIMVGLSFAVALGQDQADQPPQEEAQNITLFLPLVEGSGVQNEDINEATSQIAKEIEPIIEEVIEPIAGEVAEQTPASEEVTAAAAAAGWKGVGIANQILPTDADAMKVALAYGSLNANWWYDWTARTKYLPDRRFVPMVFDTLVSASAVQNAAAVEPKNRTWLIFNEPDLAGISGTAAANSYKTFYDAIKAGSGNQAKVIVGGTISLPTSSMGKTWWDAFLARVAQLNVPIDGIHVHLYAHESRFNGCNNPTAHTSTAYGVTAECLIDKLEETATYFKNKGARTANKPIWVTEVAILGNNQWNTNLISSGFMTKLVTDFITARNVNPLLERMAWFSYNSPHAPVNLPADGWMNIDDNLVDNNGILTPQGQTWRFSEDVLPARSAYDYNRDGYPDLLFINTYNSFYNKTLFTSAGGNGTPPYGYFGYFLCNGCITPTLALRTQYSYHVADYNNDGVTDVWFVKFSGTSSGRTEVHIMDGAHHSRWLAQTTTALGTTGAEFNFGVGDYNNDGKPDLWAIKTIGTASGKTEVHIMNGNNFNQFLMQSSTVMGPLNSSWNTAVGDYNGDKFADLWLICRIGCTSSTLVAVVNGANLQAWLVPPTPSTAMATTAATYFNFFVADFNRDSRLDLHVVQKTGGSCSVGLVCVTVLNGSNNFLTSLGTYTGANSNFTTTDDWLVPGTDRAGVIGE